MAPVRMRYLVFSVGLIAVVGLAACGGDAPAVTPPPPPPPPPPVPTATTVAAFAGTGQSVAAGQAAAIAPAVIVRDAEGKPFAGATVQFTVTDGGGSLEGAAPVSGADGVARVTRWTVGVIGVQRISAVVGALAPVTIDATIIPNSDVVTTSVPTTGGVVTITTSGHPYKGLTLTIPTGALPAATNWEMRLRTDLTLPTLPTGYRVGGPILEISNDAPVGGKLMTLDVPIQRPAGEGLVLAFYDPARGVMEVLPTVAQTDSSTRVVTTHLRADLLMGSSAAGVLARVNSAASAGTAGALIPITFSLPQPTAQAAFNPATDAWPVLDHGADDAPDGFSGVISLFQMVAKSSGTDLSTLVTPLASPGLYADAGAIGTLIEGNALMQPMLAQLATMDAQIGAQTGAQATADALTAQNVTAQIAMTGLPTMLAHYNSNTGPVAGETFYTNPVTSSGSQVTVMRSWDSAPSTLVRASVQFQSMTVDPMYHGTPTITDRVLYTPGFVAPTRAARVLMQQLKTLYGLTGTARDQMNDQIATRTGMQKPSLELESVPGGGWYPPDPSQPQALRGNSLKVRVAGGTDEFVVHDRTTGLELGNSSGSGLDMDPYVGPQRGNVRRMVLVRRKVRRVPPTRAGYPTRVDIERAPFRAIPDSVQITSDSLTARFDTDVSPKPTGGFRVVWDWGDGTTSQQQDSSSATHKYAVAGNYTVTVRLRSADGLVLYAVDSAHVVSEMSPHWQLTSMQNADTLDLNVPIPVAAILRQAIASPSSAMIAVDDVVGGGSTLSLRFNKTGAWTASNCCGPRPVPAPNELQELLGAVPIVSSAPTDRAFQGYTESRWSESIPDLGAGSMDGQHPNGSFLYEFRPPLGPLEPSIFRTGPEYVLRFTATRNGTAMSGVITLYYWPFEEATPTEPHGYFDRDPTSASFPFTAVRMK